MGFSSEWICRGLNCWSHLQIYISIPMKMTMSLSYTGCDLLYDLIKKWDSQVLLHFPTQDEFHFFHNEVPPPQKIHHLWWPAVEKLNYFFGDSLYPETYQECEYVPLLYLRKIAMVKGQILFSTLAVKAGSTVQTMQSVSITRFRTSELNWAAKWMRPSRILGR